MRLALYGTEKIQLKPRSLFTKMKSITPPFLLFRLFGICPITFEKFRIIYSLTTLLILITLTIGWITLHNNQLIKHNVNTYTKIVSINEIISCSSGNLIYALTLFYTKLYCSKYNKFFANILNAVLKIKQQQNFYQRIFVETNCLSIIYIIFLICCGYLWINEITIETILYHINYTIYMVSYWHKFYIVLYTLYNNYIIKIIR